MNATLNTSATLSPAVSMDEQMFVTMRLDRQLFGIQVRHVRDVLRAQKITTIPLAPKEVAGSLNLRGRIVTVVNVRKRLGLEAALSQASDKNMFVVVEHKGELYSLMVDSVGDVLTASAAMIEKVPANLDGRWKQAASGIFKMENELLVIMDVGALLTLGVQA